MTLTVVGSSSAGNAYVIQNDDEALLLELGVQFRKIQEALGYDLRKVVGALVTHEHTDHAGYMNAALSYALPVYATAGTIRAASSALRAGYAPIPLQRQGEDGYKPVKLGRFTVIPFATQHDAAEPVGYYISHPQTGAILFATDTYYIRPQFKNLRHIVIECNYSTDMLEKNLANGVVSEARAARTRASHMSLAECRKTLQRTCLDRVSEITLIHISNDNGRAGAFSRAIQRATGLPVYTAHPGLTVNLDKGF